MKIKLSVCTLILLAGISQLFATDWPKTYTFNPIAVSCSTSGPDSNEICELCEEQCWFGFDISNMPDTEQIAAAYFTIGIVDCNDPIEVLLWYNSDDEWITGNDIPDGNEPGELLGTITHDGGDAVVTIEINTNMHDWAADIEDGFISLIVTGSSETDQCCGAVDFNSVFLELVTMPVLTDTNGDGTILNLGPAELVKAGGVDIVVPGYSVPSFVDWNNDKLYDLIIGEGGAFGDAKVRVYLNVGTESEPQFSNYFYAKSNNSDLVCPASGCMGCFPRVVYWDSDDNKDLLVGRADGTVKIYLNVESEQNPSFDGGTFLKVGNRDINVGMRATPSVVDWNSDGKKDLVSGAYDSRIHIFINEGTDTEPVFLMETFAQADGSSLIVTGQRSSPVILDLNGDGKKDILSGNTNGQLFFYANVGSDEEPVFSDYTQVKSNGVPIDLPGSPRSRPFVCYWTGDGYFGPIDAYPDVLIGAGDGRVRLYRNIPAETDTKDK